MDSETPRPTGPGYPAAATTTRPAIPVPGTHAPGADAPGSKTPRAGPRDLSHGPALGVIAQVRAAGRSEEHTSELQSRGHLVCRLLLEKKKKNEVEQQLTSRLT